MACCNLDDFWTRYRILCLQNKVCPLKSVLKRVQGTALCCPVELVRKEHWPFLLEALRYDSSLTKVEFVCNLSHASQQPSKKKQKIMDKYFPIPYGCTASNVSDLCRALASMVMVSQRLVDVRLENLILSKENILMLGESLCRSYIKILSLSDSQIDDESFELLCQKLYNSQVSYLNLNSCHVTGERLKALCRLLKYNRNKRSKEMYFMSLRNQTPILDDMNGLHRVTLNDNDFGDEGVQMIMEHLEDDLWIKVLDFQKCGIGNEGAKCILNALKSNVTFQAIDLRQNNIDKTYIAKIILQLSLNNSGKELMLDLGPLWSPKRLTIRAPRPRLLKTKPAKTPPKVKAYQKKHTNCPGAFENAFIFSQDMLKLKPTISIDGCSQTDYIPVDEEIRKIQKTLSNEIKLRECLMHLLKKYKMENIMLRDEILKLSKLDDHILIDLETFSEVKNTFEKFKRFLNVMKEYGLFECIAMLGVNENTDIVLKPMIVNATKKCMQLIENEPSPTTSASEPVESVLSNENTNDEDCPDPSNWYMGHNPDAQTAMKQNGPCPRYTQEKKEYNHLKKITPADKALVQRVYREVRENYSNSSQSGHPSFPPKLIARRPEMPVRKRPKSNSKISLGKDISKIEAAHKLKNLRVPKEFYNAVVKDINKCDGCVVHNSLSSSSGRAAVGSIQRKTVSSQTPVGSSAQQSPSRTDASRTDKTSTSGASGNKNPETVASSKQEASSSVSDSQGSQKVPPNARPKLKGTSKRGKGTETNTPSVSSVSKHPTSISQNAVSSDSSSKTSRAVSVTGVRVHSNVIPPQLATNSGTKTSKPTGVTPSSSSSSVDSYNSQEGLGLQSSSEGKNDSGKSYLESVSDASTDKDVKSLAESEVYSMATNPKESKAPSESSVVASKADASSNPSRSSKSSKKKRSKNSSKNSVSQSNVKKNASDSSVPSLSDITTVSSRSLNTNSVLGQLSNEES